MKCEKKFIDKLMCHPKPRWFNYTLLE